MIIVEIVVLVAAAFVAAHLFLRSKPLSQPYIVSHRGAKGLAPENTLMGVQEAIRRKVAWTEIDIRRASDGTLFVMHDSNVKRTTGRDIEADTLTAAEIAGLVVKTEPGVTPPAQDVVPLLDTILETIAASHTTGLFIEVKDPDRYPGIAAQVVEALTRTNTLGKVIVGSFDHAWLGEFQPLAPAVPVAPIDVWGFGDTGAPPAGYADVYWARPVLDPTFVRRMHAAGKQVLVWTVDSPWLMRLMLWLGVDGITTNRPDVGQSMPAVSQ